MNAESIKVVFLGDSGVGKTSIVSKYINGIFPEQSEPTVGAAFVSKETQFQNHRFQLLIWDTAGQELYRSLAPMYYRSASIAIVVFDVSSKQTFESVEYWIQEIRGNCENNAVIIVVGNKADTDETREIETEQASQCIRNLSAEYIETSAKTGFNILRLFDLALSKHISSRTLKAIPSDVEVVPTVATKSDCC